LPKNKSIGSFGEVFEYIQTLDSCNDLHPIAQDLKKTLTTDEKELSFLFNYFIFKKDTPTDEKIIKVYESIIHNLLKTSQIKDIVKSTKLVSTKIKEIVKIAKKKLAIQYDYQDSIYTNAVNRIINDISSGKIRLAAETVSVTSAVTSAASSVASISAVEAPVQDAPKAAAPKTLVKPVRRIVIRKPAPKEGGGMISEIQINSIGKDFSKLYMDYITKTKSYSASDIKPLIELGIALIQKYKILKDNSEYSQKLIQIGHIVKELQN